jgi:glycosyltransferase involved in cell wall biosynthesis
MRDLSGVILARNEEKNIRRCIEALRFCGEILVIDDYSSDKTREIASRMGARVIKRHLNGDFAGQRNFGLSRAGSEWVLFIDADEVVSDELRKEIKKVLPRTACNGFYIRRKDVWLGKELSQGEWGKARLLRLGRRKKGGWKRRIHEKWEIDGKVGVLRGKLIHYLHESVFETLVQINFHSGLHAKENKKEGKRALVGKIIIYPVGKFFQNYLIKGGAWDGAAGFVLAVMMSFHSFLAWSEQWLE